ncbi:hypothetical protein BP5796_11583 [Coleophoma crateriformis]|uniref:Uncharacterized protein n=1 Tax=Coleophoma crateriformis TaxID=565419 RepID=A0A3D8QE21_9HELO|nr:hypothetical protein BP5796_11583 [Coleophoma crateriformis]
MQVRTAGAGAGARCRSVQVGAGAGGAGAGPGAGAGAGADAGRDDARTTDLRTLQAERDEMSGALARRVKKGQRGASCRSVARLPHLAPGGTAPALAQPIFRARRLPLGGHVQGAVRCLPLTNEAEQPTRAGQERREDNIGSVSGIPSSQGQARPGRVEQWRGTLLASARAISSGKGSTALVRLWRDLTSDRGTGECHWSPRLHWSEDEAARSTTTMRCTVRPSCPARHARGGRGAIALAARPKGFEGKAAAAAAAKSLESLALAIALPA